MELIERVDLLEDKLNTLRLDHNQLSVQVGSSEGGLVKQFAKLEECMERLTSQMGYIKTILIVGIALAIGKDGIIVLLKVLAH